MSRKRFNQHLYQLAKEAGATDEKGLSIDSGVISFTVSEFQDFMAKYACYVQRRQQALKNDNENVSFLDLTQEVWNTLYEEVEN